MPTKTINLSIPQSLLDEADEVARDESRSRSELMREALRRYVLIKQYRVLSRSAQAEAKAQGFKPEDVDRIMDEVRHGGINWLATAA